MGTLNATSLAACFVFVTQTAVGLGNPVMDSHDYTLTIRLFDHSHTGAAQIREAQRGTEQILRHARIAVHWQSCPTMGSLSPDVAVCESLADLDHLDLVLLPDEMARKVSRGSQDFGLAVLAESGRLAVRAYIFVDRAIDLANEEMIPWTRILGYLMAHEIGHLLMGTNSHSLQGIMKGNWRRKEVKEALSGRLTFTSQECSRLRSAIEHRR